MVGSEGWQLHETTLCPCLINCSVQLQASAALTAGFSVAKKFLFPGEQNNPNADRRIQENRANFKLAFYTSEYTSVAQQSIWV